MYWLLGPEYHKRPRAENRKDLKASIVDGRPPGLLAFDERDRAVGWCRLTPRAELGWLESKPFLATVDDLPVWSLPCFYIRNGHRGQGIMSALIHAALLAAKNAGAPAVEGYPIDTAVEGSSRNLFPGTVSAFTRAGFTTVVADSPTRPVMRHDLTRV